MSTFVNFNNRKEIVTEGYSVRMIKRALYSVETKNVNRVNKLVEGLEGKIQLSEAISLFTDKLGAMSALDAAKTQVISEGQFSWMTQDNGTQIGSERENRITVYMYDNKGNQYKESKYDGYGEFGGMDYYELLARMNGYSEEDLGKGQEMRNLGIDLAFGNLKTKADGKKVLFPALVEDPRYNWKRHDFTKEAESDPNQSWYQEEEDDRYGYDDYYEAKTNETELKYRKTLTKKEWNKAQKDSKTIIDGVHYMMFLDDNLGTILAPVEVTEGNAFGAARAEAIANGDKEFTVDGETYPVENVDKEDKENAEEFTNEAKFVKDFNRDVLKATTKEEVLEIYPNAEFYVGKMSHFFGELEPNLFFKAYYADWYKKDTGKSIKGDFKIVSIYSEKGSKYVDLYNESVKVDEARAVKRFDKKLIDHKTQPHQQGGLKMIYKGATGNVDMEVTEKWLELKGLRELPEDWRGQHLGMFFELKKNLYMWAKDMESSQTGRPARDSSGEAYFNVMAIFTMDGDEILTLWERPSNLPVATHGGPGVGFQYESVVTENYEVIYSDGVSAMKKFRTEKQALDFMKQTIASNKKLRDIAVYKPGMYSTTQTELVVSFWGERSYLDNVSKKDPKLAAKKLEESVVTEKIKVTKDKWPYLEFKDGGKTHKVEFDYEDIIDDHGNEGQDQYWVGKDEDGQEWMIDVYADYRGEVEEVHYDTIVKESVVTEGRSINKIQKEWTQVTADMKITVDDWKKAEGDTKSQLLDKLKELTTRKRKLEVELDSAVGLKDADAELVGESYTDDDINMSYGFYGTINDYEGNDKITRALFDRSVKDLMKEYKLSEKEALNVLNSKMGRKAADQIVDGEAKTAIDGFESYYGKHLKKEMAAAKSIDEGEKLSWESLVESVNRPITNEDLRSNLKKYIKKNEDELNSLADNDDWESIHRLVRSKFGTEEGSREDKDLIDTFMFMF